MLPTAIANVPFWTPDSIEIVVAFFLSSLINLAVASPNPSINIIKEMATGPKVAKFPKKASQFFASAAMTIKTKNPTASFEIPGAILLTMSEDFAVITIPKATGTAVMRNMVKPSLVTLTGGAFSPMKCTTLNDTNIGTVTMDNKLVTAVNEIESGAFPPASFASILLVTPPGHMAIIINPTAKI